MKNKIYHLIAASVMLTISSMGTVHAQFSGGDGTPQNPFQISTPTQLDEVRNHLNAHFVVTADLDMSSFENFAPIGSYTNATNNNPFTGSFDGGGFTISNLTMTSTVTNSGLFSYFMPTISGDTIQNIVIKNSVFNFVGTSGSIVGRLHHGTVANCMVNARVLGGGVTIGGIVGTATGNSVIARCWFADTITNDGNTVGGIAGSINDSTLITDCYTSGHVEAIDARNFAAGIVAMANNHSMIQNSYSSASVRANRRVGGIVAQLNQGARDATFAPIVQNCVAANRSLIQVVNEPDISRVVGGYGGTGLITGSGAGDTILIRSMVRNNYALNNMDFYRADSTFTEFSADSLNGLDGLNKTLTQLQTKATYTTAPFDWDFNGIWIMNVDGDGLPMFGINNDDDDHGNGTSIQDCWLETATDIKILVSPNPTRGNVTVEVKNGANIRQILVFSMNGQQVFSTTNPKFNIEKFQSGLYIIHVVTDRGNFVERIMKW